MSDTLNLTPQGSIDSAYFGNFNKIVDKNLAYIGDILTYTINFQNTGTLLANNVIFKDTLPKGTKFIDDSINFNGIQQLGMDYSDLQGVSLGRFSPGEDKFLSFKVVVTTLPVGNLTYNEASLNYTYRIPPNYETIPAFDTSNVAFTEITINYMVLNSIKYVDRLYSDVGSTLTYSVVYNNEGNTSANKVVFKDTIPEGTSFVTDSITINGTNIAGAISPLGYNLGTIPVGITTLTFKVKVDTIPTINPINNIGSTAYRYTVETTLSNARRESSQTNSVSTKINSAIIYGNESVDKNFVDIGDAITYTIVIRNMGNTEATNVIVQATIPSEGSFINNSSMINGILSNIGDPNTGFNLGTIPIGTVTLTFKILVNSLPTQNPILNSGFISYNYTVDPFLPNGQSASVNTNVVSSTVNGALINSKKYVDKAYADVGENLVYTVVLSNEGNKEATNSIFKDTIPNGLLFVTDSFSVNGITQTGANVLSGINLGTIPVGVTTVNFNVVVNTIPSINPALNEGIINYVYTVDPSIPNGKNREGITNKVSTKINSVFLNTRNFVSKIYADVGNTITYKLAMINTGNISASNVVILETLPNGIEYVNSSVNIVSNFATINADNIDYNSNQETLKIEISTVPKGTTTVSFNVLVQSIPNLSLVLNQGIIKYNYTVDPSIPNGYEKTVETSVVSTKINSALLEVAKYADKEDADKNDLLEYTISINNKGNTEGRNVVILDTIPEGTAFVENSFKINDNLTNINNINSIFNMDSIPVGVTTISYKVLVNTLPSVNFALNEAIISYKYTVNPSMINSESRTVNSNTINTNIKYVDIKAENIANKKYADVGDTITYTLVLTNNGNIVADNLVVRETYEDEIQVTANTLALDGVLFTQGENLVDGISIDELIAGGVTTITFDVLVNSIPSTNPVENFAQTIYSYTIEPTIPNGRSDVCISNTEYTKINRVYLDTSKNVDMNYAAVGDTLTYSIPLVNTGTTEAINIFIQDTIANGTSFDTGSITLNGIALNTIGEPNLGFTISAVPIGTSTVAFKVKVDTIPSPNTISNEATILYNYIVDPSIVSSKNGSLYTNAVTTEIKSAFLNSYKYSDKNFANLNETINYMMVVDNYGNVPANNVFIKDVINNEINFVDGSLNIDGATIANGYDSNGIKLGTINVGRSTVNFSVIVTSVPSPNPIGKEHLLKYQYTVNPLNVNSYDTIVKGYGEETQINYINLKNSKKTVDKQFATCGDILTYTIAIPNSGNVAAGNLYISDTIPNGSTFIVDSLLVNGVSVPGTPDCIFIGTIPVGGVATVNFKVTVDCQIT